MTKRILLCSPSITIALRSSAATATYRAMPISGDLAALIGGAAISPVALVALFSDQDYRRLHHIRGECANDRNICPESLRMIIV